MENIFWKKSSRCQFFTRKRTLRRKYQIRYFRKGNIKINKYPVFIFSRSQIKTKLIRINHLNHHVLFLFIDSGQYRYTRQKDEPILSSRWNYLVMRLMQFYFQIVNPSYSARFKVINWIDQIILNTCTGFTHTESDLSPNYYLLLFLPSLYNYTPAYICASISIFRKSFYFIYIWNRKIFEKYL